MLDHDPEFRRQLSRERLERLAADYESSRSTAPGDPSARAGRDPRRIAALLGLDEGSVRRLRRRGVLLRLDLTREQIRARLYEAHLRHLGRGRAE